MKQGENDKTESEIKQENEMNCWNHGMHWLDEL